MDALDLFVQVNSEVKVLLARSFQKYWRMLSWSAVQGPGNFNSALILCKQEMGNSKFSSSKSDILKCENVRTENLHNVVTMGSVPTAFSLWNQSRNFLLCLLLSFIYLKQKESNHFSMVLSQLYLGIKVFCCYSWWVPSSLKYWHADKSRRKG